MTEHGFVVAKLPELLRTKSANHTRLEQALQKNKAAVFEVLSSSSNASLLKELRDEASRLTKELTQEVQWEYREQRK